MEVQEQFCGAVFLLHPYVGSGELNVGLQACSFPMEPYHQPWVFALMMSSGRSPGSTFPGDRSQGCCPCDRPGMMVKQAQGYPWSLGGLSFSCFRFQSPDPSLLQHTIHHVCTTWLLKTERTGKKVSQSVSVWFISAHLSEIGSAPFCSAIDNWWPRSVKSYCEVFLIMSLKVCASHRPVGARGGEQRVRVMLCPLWHAPHMSK